MKKLYSRTILLGGIIFLLVINGAAFAATEIDNMSKEDLYRMILELKQEVQELKQNQGTPSEGVAGEKDIKRIVQKELATRQAENESLLDKVDIHASISQGFLYTNENKWFGDTDDGTMDYNEFTINFSTELTDKLRAGLQFMSRDLGDYVNNELRLDWANLDYAWKDGLSFRTGIIKMPFGLYNESRDIDAARVAVMLPQGFYSENIRELSSDIMGFSIYGALNSSSMGTLSYKLIYGGSDVDNEGEIAAVFTTIGAFDEDSVTEIKLKNVTAGALNWQTPIDGLLLNASGQYGEIEACGSKTLYGYILDVELSDDTFYNYSFGVEYSLDNLVLAAEYRKAKAGYTYEVDALGSTTELEKTFPSGWYLSASYRFTDWFASEVSYSEYWYNADDKDGETDYGSGAWGIFAYQNTISLNARFDINDYWIIKAGVNFNEGMGTGYNFQNDGDADEDWVLYQLKTTVSF